MFGVHRSHERDRSVHRRRTYQPKRHLYNMEVLDGKEVDRYACKGILAFSILFLIARKEHVLETPPPMQLTTLTKHRGTRTDSRKHAPIHVTCYARPHTTNTQQEHTHTLSL